MAIGQAPETAVLPVKPPAELHGLGRLTGGMWLLTAAGGAWNRSSIMSAGNRRDRTGASVFSRGEPSPRAASHRDGSAFGELVRERRMSIGLTQRELADAAGMSIGALRDLEQGRTRCPRWGAVAAFAAALGMDRHQRAELASAWSGGQPDGGSGYGPLEGEAAGAGGTDVRIGVLGLLTVLRGPAVASSWARRGSGRCSGCWRCTDRPG